ncbi:MAG: glycosyl hydrolase family protein, partial [Hymenobacter sp.]
GGVLCGSLLSARAQTYQQVWADEFTNGIGPDWVFETGNNGGWGNNEKEYYQAANATVVNGELRITAKKESVNGYSYTSARMKTQGLKDFKFGRIEARMKLPLGQGLWPGFWMMGSNITTVNWPSCGEIDIMEHINATNTIFGTAHWNSNGHAQYGLTTSVTTPDDWHVYSIEWTPTYIKWFADGNQFCVINIANGVGNTGAFQNPFFILLNLAVGGNLPGQTIDESKLPATLAVDYVRVSQLTPLAAAPGAPAPAGFALYPNPRQAGEPLILALPACDATHPATVRLLDALGRELWHTTATSPTLELRAAQHLRGGLYLVQFTDASGQHTQRLQVP